jgi:hypothetical protein
VKGQSAESGEKAFKGTMLTFRNHIIQDLLHKRKMLLRKCNNESCKDIIKITTYKGRDERVIFTNRRLTGYWVMFSVLVIQVAAVIYCAVMRIKGRRKKAFGRGELLITVMACIISTFLALNNYFYPLSFLGKNTIDS